MGKKKPRTVIEGKELLENKTLLTVKFEFDVDTILGADMSPSAFGDMIIRHMYKTLPYTEKNSTFTINQEVLDELNR